MHWSQHRCLPLALAVIVGFGLSYVAGAEPVEKNNKGQGDRFSGTIKLRQKDGTLYYQVTVVRGKVVDGFVSYSTSAAATQDIVGGWYDGERLVLLMQNRNENLDDKWFAHAHHFRQDKDDKGFTLEHTLYGYGKSLDPKIVYRPHVIEQLRTFTKDELDQIADQERREQQLRRDAARLPMLLEQNRQLQETIRHLRRD